MQVDLGMLGTVAGTVSCVCNFGRPEVAAACSFAAMVGGNMDCVRDITCRMIDQVWEYAQHLGGLLHPMLKPSRSSIYPKPHTLFHDLQREIHVLTSKAQSAQGESSSCTSKSIRGLS